MLAVEVNNQKIEMMETRVEEINKIEKMRAQRKARRMEKHKKDTDNILS